jgi:hypothetical protein
LGAVYYIDTGNPLPDFAAGKPAKSDKKQFFKGDWKEAWPKGYRAHKEEK